MVAEGNLSMVYRARPTGTAEDRPTAYALKTLRPQWEKSPEAVSLMHREALVAICSETVHARIGPDIGSVAPVCAQLHIILMAFTANAVHTNQLML